MNPDEEAEVSPLKHQSAHFYIPPRRNEPKEMSYFNRECEAKEVFTYDQVCHHTEDFQRKQPKRHFQGRKLAVNGEEKLRTVPLLSSSQYGFRSNPALCQTEQNFKRVACIKSNFFTKNGITWNLEEGYGSVAPF